MPKEIYLLVAVIVAAVAIAVYLLNRKLNQLSQASKSEENLLKIIENLQQVPVNLQKGLQQQSKNLSDSLQQSTATMNKRLDNAARYISEVAERVGEMSEIGRSMKELQEFLKSPKLRGNIGEEVLKDLISQMFSKNSFYLQYAFKSGEKVDAAIKTDAGLLPIDSKFPMENFQRMMAAENKTEKNRLQKAFTVDVKKHIRDISKKYILQEEGTMDFALMYIPSESVYYEIVNIPDLTDYARRARVYPVSPTTLYAHLQTILLSFEGQKIEARSREVFRLLRAIQKDYEKTEGVLSVLGKHINNAYSQFANALQSFSLLGQKLSSTRVLSESIEETKQLDKNEKAA
ncbi:DNA recombination protein RmuC [Patescibacteria group bacterium]|nr:DNA recombination protein RmuC [Patescibacteria group bacterium]